MTSNEPTPKVCGRIVCLKECDNEEIDQQTFTKAAEVIARFNHDKKPCQEFCSDLIHGFAFDPEDLCEECVKALDEEGLLDHIEDDIEVVGYENRPWGTERVGVFESPSSNVQRDGEKNRYKGADVDVFVLDSGVEKNHPYLNVVETRSFIRSEPQTDDLNGHGTQCAGIIGALDRGWKPGEFIDVVGVAPGVRIHGYKVLGRNGSGRFSDIIAGVENVNAFKRRNPEKRVVVNMSLGGFVGTQRYTALDRELARLVEKRDVTVIVAAGNDNRDSTLYSPAHTKECITVGAFDQNDTFSTYSNFGHAVDILAPGNDIRTSTINGGVAAVTGTSFAAPFVCGAAALILAKEENKLLKPHQVEGQLLALCKKNIKRVPNGTPDLTLQVNLL